MIRSRLRIGGMVEIPVGILFRGLCFFGLRLRLGFCGCRSGRRFCSRRRADGGANPGIVLASSHQIAKRKEDSEDNDKEQKQSDQVPALQYEIAAAFFLS